MTANSSLLEYWRQRGRKYGRRAVLNLSHPEHAFDAVTATHISEVFPYLEKHLAGTDRIVLDFGCGAGRFSAALGMLTGGQVIAVDPIESLLRLAPQSPAVDYRLIDKGRIPVDTGSIDFLWIYGVLGGIPDASLPTVVEQLKSLVKPGALVCVVENTTKKPNIDHWFYRGVTEYQQLLDWANLAHVHDFQDQQEAFSVLIGRRA